MGSRTPAGRRTWEKYWANSIEVPGPNTEILGGAARDAQGYLAIGVIERDSRFSRGTLFCTLLYFGPDGQLLGKHRKLKPTAGERLIWGEGDGSTMPVFSTPFGKLGGLICWENYMPLARTAMYAKGVEVYLAPTADQRVSWHATLRHIACEGRCFVLGCNQFVTKDMYPPDLEGYDLTKEVLGELPTVRALIWSDDMAGASPPDDRFREFKAWYKTYPATEPDTVLRIEDPCQMTYTSGTELLPKGVIISYQALIAQYMGCIIDGGYDATDINVNALPIYHCAQRDVFLNPIFWLGGTNVLMAPDIGRILKTIADYRASMFFAPPTVWIGMLRHPDFGKHDLSSLKKCYYGASIMPVEVLKEMLERLPGAKIFNYYGQTELAPYLTILKASDAMTKLGSAGMGGLNMETRLEDAMGDV